MQRYFVENAAVCGTEVRIAGGDLHHIRNVMRMKPGAEVHVVDGDGRALLCVLRAFEPDAAVFAVVRELETKASGPFVGIAQALIRKDRFEWMIEKATELGAAEIVPTVFSRSVVKLEPADEPRKLERYRAIAKEAAEQSRRTAIPSIRPVAKLADLPFSDYDRVYVCYEASGTEDMLFRVVKPADLDGKLLFIVGPEGGIAPDELDFLKSRGCVVCGLGSRILRSETASMYVLSALDALFEASR
ncbi:MAG: RsmE family RNA methyltransferase [Candidatus Izemoplasmatales bacterium]